MESNYGAMNSYGMTAQGMNNRQTYKIFFFSLNVGHAETLIQVLVSGGHSDILSAAYGGTLRHTAYCLCHLWFLPIPK